MVTEKQMDLIYFHVTKLFILTIPAIANILDSGKGVDIVIRNIARDEEATYDYRSFPRDSDEFEFECMCNEDDCFRVVTTIDDHPPAQRSELRKVLEK
jgi:hypothetical protein